MSIQEEFQKRQFQQLKEYIDEHGIDYTLRKGPYDWQHIFDSEFHKLREYYIQHANLVDFLIELRLKEDRKDG